MKSSIKTQSRSFLSQTLRSAWLAITILSLTAAPAVLADGHKDKDKDKHKDKGPHIYPPQSQPFGKSYSEWHAAFWQWALARPIEGHPFIDDPDYDFSAGQSGKVWFVGAPDGPLTRQATISEGTALFLTIRDVETSSLELPPFFGATEADQRANSKWFADHIVDLFCIIDGVPVKNLEAYRFASPQFEFTAPTPWVWGNPDDNVGGPGTGVGDGYFVMVDSFSKGHHTIHFGGTFRFAPGELAEEAVDLPHDVTIELTVGKDRGHGHGDDGCDKDRADGRGGRR